MFIAQGILEITDTQMYKIVLLKYKCDKKKVCTPPPLPPIPKSFLRPCDTEI